MQPPEIEQPERSELLPSGMTIERVSEPVRLREIEDLQFQVWGGDLREVIPTHMLYIAEKSGGILLAAYDRGRLAGFVLGLLGRSDGRLYHVSHILGIHPDYQGKGIGAALKHAQRDQALAQGLTLMTWTYDPLEARNAHFNLHKLGATSRIYHENLYGDMEDDLNRGMPSDRLTVKWQLERLRPAGQCLRPTGRCLRPTGRCLRPTGRCLRPAGRQPPRQVGATDEPVPLLTNEGDQPLRYPAPPPASTLLSVAIPPNIQVIKTANLQVALAWRLAVRKALFWAFAHNYRAIDFTEGAYLLALDADHQVPIHTAVIPTERDDHAN